MKQSSTYTLVAFGDLLLQKRFEWAPELEKVRGLIGQADHAFANLEMALTTRGEQADKLVCLRGDPGLVREVLELGMDVVTGANNHAMDFGMTGLRDTIATCRDAGLPLVGVGDTLEESLRPAILEGEGRRVAFIGVSTPSAEGTGAGPSRPGIAPIRIFTRYVIDASALAEVPGGLPYVETKPMPGDIERVEEVVAAAKESADLVIVGMHWGVPAGWGSPSQHEISDYQQPLAHRLIDAGADAIIGHHAHYLQGVELYRKRPIFYSLGNFIWHRVSGREIHRPYPAYTWGGSLARELGLHGGMARLSWPEKEAAPSVEFVPLRLDAEGNPRPCSAEEAAFAFTRVEEGSEIFGTGLRREETEQGPVLVVENAA